MAKSLSILLLLFSFQVFSQNSVTQVKGFITDSLNKPVIMASVLIKRSNKNGIIAFARTNEKGFFSFSFKPDTTHYTLNVNAMNYESLSKNVAINQGDITQNFILKNKNITLNEVIVSGKTQSMRVGEDSTIYKAKRFLDGSEKSVEDLLKKLPGVQVTESGKVYFKGKMVQKVYLDGDDLLGENYTMATRSIDPTMINEVQALENFSTNTLLKGIEKSDKTVLNLSFNEDRKRFVFGNIKAAYGNSDFRDFNVSIFSYLKKLKIYAIGTHNNIGTKNNPEGDAIPDMEKVIEETPITQPLAIINIDNLYSPTFKTERLNFNMESLASINSIYSPVKNLKIKSILSFYGDKNSQNQFSENNYLLNRNSFSISEINQLRRNPKVGTARIEMEYSLKDNAKLLYKIGGQYIRSDIEHDVLFKSDSIRENISEVLQNRFNFFNQSLNYTYRYANKKALTIDINHQISDLPQNYAIQTDGLRYANFFRLNNTYQAVNQLTNSPLNEISISGKLFGVKNKDKYYFQAGINYSGHALNTNLYVENSKKDSLFAPTDFQNTLRLEKMDFFTSIGIAHPLKDWIFTGNLSSHYLTLALDQEGILKKQAVYVEPKLSVLYRFSKITSLRASYQYSRNFSTVNDLASNFWLQGYRNFSKGLPEIIQTNSQNYTLIFGHLDTYNQFSMMSSIIYLKRNNAFGSIYSLTNVFDISEKSIIPSNDLMLYSFTVSKYFPVVLSNLKIETSISRNTFTNEINDGSVRNNILTNGNYKFSYVSAFNGKFNLSAGAAFQNGSFKSVINEIINQGNNEWWSSSVNLRYRNKKYFFSVNTEYFLVKNKAYNFMDANAKYNFKDRKTTVEIIAKNILNTSTFQQIFLSDFSTNKLEYSLLPRFFLLSINYSF